MRTTELFKFNRSSKRISESLQKTFGTKINFEEFDTAKLEDARNKLRTQIHTARTESGFNENLENDTLSKAQFMHDAIVAELMDRQEHIVDAPVEEEAPFGSNYAEQLAKEVFDHNPNLRTSGKADELLNLAYNMAKGELGSRAQGIFRDEDFPSDLVSAYAYLQKQGGDTDESLEQEAGYGGHDAYQRDYDSSVSGFGRRNRADDWDEGNTEPPNNFAIYINGKKWKVFPGRGTYADDYREKAQHQQLRDMCAKKTAATGKKWEVVPTGENPTESISTEASHQEKTTMKHVKNPTAGEKDAAKDIKAGTAGYRDRVAMLKSAEADGRLKKESIEQTGEDMRNLNEGEIQQASAIVTAKTMVDRVGRWIEELSGMENDTLLQLGDSIRDEMGQEQAKGFIEAVAPAIQQALENLKSTREALASGVRTLTGEEQSAGMLGAEPAGEPGAEMGGELGGEMGPAEPDAMNAEPADDFAAAEPAAGGLGDAGREQRESIQRSSNLLRVLAG